jgi:hypothetical protein
MPKRERTAISEELNQILDRSAETDLLGNVIRSDRHRAGRALPADQDTLPSHAVLGPYDKHTSTQALQRTGSQTEKHADSAALLPADCLKQPAAIRARSPRVRRNTNPHGEMLTARLAEAARMAEGISTTLTLRIPKDFSDWLDEYVHRAWPEKVLKQQLVIEGLRMLFVRRGRPGEPILPTQLLADDST